MSLLAIPENLVGWGLGDWDVGRVFGMWDTWAGTWGRGHGDAQTKTKFSASNV